MTTLLASVGSSILGSVATKTFDSLVTSKFTNKNDKNKWIREKTLILFSELNHEIQNITCENLEEKQKTVKQMVYRINLLIDDKKLQTNLENYSFILDEYKCFKNEIDLEHINKELFKTLKLYMNRI